MRDVKITGGRRISVIDNSTGGGGLGGFEGLLMVGAVIFAAAVALQAAAAVAAAVAAILITVFWCLAGLAGAATVAVIAGLAYRYRKTGSLRRIDRPGRAAVIRSGRPTVITDAPPRPQLESHAPRLHPDDLAELARQIRGGR